MEATGALHQRAASPPAVDGSPRARRRVAGGPRRPAGHRLDPAVGAPRPFEPLREQLLPLSSRVTGHVTVMLLGVVLLFTAGQLHAASTARQVAVVVSGVALVVHVLKGPQSRPRTAARFVLLVVYRDRFTAPSDPPSALRLVRVEHSSLPADRLRLRRAAGGGARSDSSPTYARGSASSRRSPSRSRRPRWCRTLRAPLPQLSSSRGHCSRSGLRAPGRAARTRVPAAHRSGTISHRRSTGRSGAARAPCYGWDTLAYFALRDDKSFFFSSDGEAMIGLHLPGRARVSSPATRSARPSRSPSSSTSSSRSAGTRRGTPAFVRGARAGAAAVLGAAVAPRSTSATRRSSAAALRFDVRVGGRRRCGRRSTRRQAPTPSACSRVEARRRARRRR